MNVVAHGVDFVDIRRLGDSLARHRQAFLDRVFTPAEQTYCMGRRNQLQHLAGRFAAKEAVMKVLGTGWSGGVAWSDIEVTNAPSGQPRVALSGTCAEVAAGLGVTRILISISHTDTHAMASAIGVGAAAST